MDTWNNKQTQRYKEGRWVLFTYDGERLLLYIKGRQIARKCNEYIVEKSHERTSLPWWQTTLTGSKKQVSLETNQQTQECTSKKGNYPYFIFWHNKPLSRALQNGCHLPVPFIIPLPGLIQRSLAILIPQVRVSTVPQQNFGYLGSAKASSVMERGGSLSWKTS